MRYVPVPGKWAKYTVESYLCKPIQLKCVYLVVLILVSIVFTSCMIYFTSLTYNQVIEIGRINYSLHDAAFECSSIGSVSSDSFDFVSHRIQPDESNSTNLTELDYEFMQYKPVYSIDEYPYLNGLNFSNWRYQKPLSSSTTGGTMNYTVDKGNGENVATCNSKFFQQLCNVSNTDNSKYSNINANNTDNVISVYFWYDIITVINVSHYAQQLQWYYNNTPDIDNGNQQFSLYYYDHQTDAVSYSTEFYYSHIPLMPALFTTYNYTFSMPHGAGVSDSVWYWALTNGGSLSSVWDLCKARFVDIGNKTVYMGWQTTRYYDNKTVFKIDPEIRGMLECWYRDRKHGWIKTDFYDSYGQNAIIPTPSNETGSMLRIASGVFDFSDTLTTISSNGDAAYVRLADAVEDTIVTTQDALQFWQNDVCSALMAGYCAWVDVPPYFCKKKVRKQWPEALALSLSPTTSACSALLISVLVMMKCKSNLCSKRRQQFTETEYGTNLLPANEMHSTNLIRH